MIKDLLLLFCLSSGYLVFILGLFVHIFEIIQTLTSWASYQKEVDASDVMFEIIKNNHELCPSISILVPAYNESVGIIKTVENLVSLNYPQFDVIVINDGSKDDTLEKLIGTFSLKKATLIPNEDIPFQPIQTIYKSQGHQNLWVIDKLNGGKADSINAGIATCQTDLFAVIDADSILGTESLIRAIRPYVQFPNKIAATGGVISGINNLVIESGRVQNLFISNQFLHNIQALEYYRAFLLGRLFWQKLGATFLISGAFGTFDRESVLDVGAYSENTVGEDIEIGFKLIRRKYETSEKRDIIFVPDPVCWTEVPSSLQILSRQRSRWQQGMMETLFTHSRMLLNKKFGIYGKFAIPFLWATEILYLPIAIIGYLSIPILYIYGYFSADFFIAFICVEFILGVFTSNIAILARQAEQNTILDPLDIMIFVCTSIIENFGYRQLCTFWRFLGAFKFITGNKSWGEMTRSGI